MKFFILNFTYFSFSANELEVLKQIFLDKEHELTIALSKVDELTKQLDQLRKIKITTNKEQSQNRNELDKLKQELMVNIFILNLFYNKLFLFF
jgi:hypothetical protein